MLLISDAWSPTKGAGGSAIQDQWSQSFFYRSEPTASSGSLFHFEITGFNSISIVSSLPYIDLCKINITNSSSRVIPFGDKFGCSLI